MNQKSTLNKEKLMKYSAMAGTVLAASGAADAQIIYTDVNPDQTIGIPGAFALDLNNDLTVDFNITASFRSGTITIGIPVSYTADGVALELFDSNQAVASSGSLYPYGLVIDATTMIDDQSSWMGNTLGEDTMFLAVDGLAGGTFPVQLGNWAGEQNKFLGLKIVVGGNTHYGWARLNVAADASSFTIKDYAYQATPATGIEAGDNGTINVSVEEQMLAGIKMRFFDSYLGVNVPEGLNNGELTVVNTTGQVIAREGLNNGSNQIQLSEMAQGIYMMSARFDEGIITKKFMIK